MGFRERLISPERLWRTAQTLLDKGAVLDGFDVVYDASGGCEKPRGVELRSSHRQVLMDRRPTWGSWGSRVGYLLGGSVPATVPVTIRLTVRCRHCPKCLKVKRDLWRYRAERETAFALRTWFGGMTLRPQEYRRDLAACRKRLALGGTDYDALPIPEQFREVCAQCGHRVTQWLKRVRAESGARDVRYLMVVEQHKSGIPHWHVLVHECDPHHAVKERVLRGQWRSVNGFCEFKLVGASVTKLGFPLNAARAVGYVVKYLSKQDNGTRVRASLLYGDVTAYCHRRELQTRREAVDPSPLSQGSGEHGSSGTPASGADQPREAVIRGRSELLDYGRRIMRRSDMDREKELNDDRVSGRRRLAERRASVSGVCRYARPVPGAKSDQLSGGRTLTDETHSDEAESPDYIPF